MKKLRSDQILIRLVILIIMWSSVTTLIQALKCPKMTQTELFLRIPNCIVLKFENCNEVHNK